MTLWMLWSILFAATVGIAALAIDRAAGGFGAPRRYIWMIALLASAVVPVLLALRRAESPAVSQEQGTRDALVDNATVEIPIAPQSVPNDPPPLLPSPSSPRTSVDRVALVLWIISSSVLALVFARSMLRLRRRRREWVDTTLRDHRVLLSSGEGPAVIGFARPTIVVPRWALLLDRRAQEMMLRHESEHIRAGDPRVLLAAGLLLVLFPWNAGIWWLVHRLRMAMELDCDARVIRSVGASREYALMLLEIGERHTTGLPLASTLSSGRPLLERRIHAMSSLRPRRPLRAALPFLAIAVVATTAAARAPRPTSLRPQAVADQQSPPAAAAVQPPRQPVPIAQPAQPARAVEPPASTAAATRARRAPLAPSAAAEPARPARPTQPRNPDRARIAGLAREHMADVVSGDTAADYAVMIFDATDQYLWSTHGLGTLAIEVAGDTRTELERIEYNRLNRAEHIGAMAAARGGGRGGRAGAGGGQAAGDATGAAGGARGGRARGGVPDSMFGVISGTVGERYARIQLDSMVTFSDSGRFVRRAGTDSAYFVRRAGTDSAYVVQLQSLMRRRDSAEQAIVVRLRDSTGVARSGGGGGRGGVRGGAARSGGGSGDVASSGGARGRGGRGGAVADSAMRADLQAMEERLRLALEGRSDGAYLIRVGPARNGMLNEASGLELPGQGRSESLGLPRPRWR